MQAWLIGLTKQMHNKRAIATGGIFKQYLKESEPENLVVDEENIDTSETKQLAGRLQYFWAAEVLDYAFDRAVTVIAS
jgi:hypothetical protein